METEIQENTLQSLYRREMYKTDDLYSLSLLQSLLIGFPYLPITASSLRPFCMAHILNDLIINNRTKIIEFGAGVSTIVLGRAIRKNQLKAVVSTIEHDRGWYEEMAKQIANEGLDNIIELAYAPLGKNKFSLDQNLWYDENTLAKHLMDKSFNMVIVDGPPAWEKGKARSRYPAIPFIRTKLEPRFSIYIDDAERIGEQSVIRLWEGELNCKFEIAGGTLGFAYKGLSFYTQPFGW